MPEKPDQSHTFGGGLTESSLTPIVLVGMLVAILLMWILPRKYVVVPFLFFALLVPMGEQVYVLGVHWLALRIIILAGWARLLQNKLSSKKPLFAGGFNFIDQAFLVSVVCQAVCMVLQYMQSQALINQIGFLIDYIGGYFLLRFMIRDKRDIYTAIKCLALLSLICAFFMVREQLTVHNDFALLGGKAVPDIREGKIRSQGPFSHALMAGCFSASLLPLFFLLWKTGKARLLAALGAVGCTVMTITSQSSSPLLAYVAGILAICCWPIRRKMRAVRWAMVIALLGAAMVMKAPVWFLIARIDLTGGSSGYHRAELIDQFVRHFGDWWLIGTKDAGTWAYDLWDTQNQYVTVGETGGLLAFGFFVAMLTRCCRQIGNARRAISNTREQWFVWLLGAALFAHLVSFFGVNYFDQSKVSWFLLLSIISVATATATAQEPKRKREEEDRNIKVLDIEEGDQQPVATAVGWN